MEDYQFHKKISEVKENLLKRSKTVFFLENNSTVSSLLTRFSFPNRFNLSFFLRLLFQPFPFFESLVHFDVTILAEQMTMLDAQLFRAIRVCDLFHALFTFCLIVVVGDS